MTEGNASRRDFVKRAAYVTPAVLTLAAAPEFAKAGSVKVIDIGKGRDPGLGKDLDLGKALGKDGASRKMGDHGNRGGPGKGQSLRKDGMTDAGSRRASAQHSKRAQGDAQTHSSSLCGRTDGGMGSVGCADRHIRGTDRS